MSESTQVWNTTHRGLEIKFWQSDRRWFAAAPGQEVAPAGHSTLRAALQSAFEFVNDGRRTAVRVPLSN